MKEIILPNLKALAGLRRSINDTGSADDQKENTQVKKRA